MVISDGNEFGARPQFLEDLRNAPGKVKLLVGGSDEVFYAEQYAPLLKPVRPDLDVTVLPGFDHMDMIIKPETIKRLVEAALSD